MKKSFTLYLILLVTAGLLASCSSAFITKRRYTRGYYVERHQHAPVAKRPEAQKTEEQKNISTVYVLPQIKTGEAPGEKTNMFEGPDKKPLAGAARLKKNPTARPAPQESLHALIPGLSVKKPIKSVQAAIELAKPTADSGDDALSLFWIVIVVILILWLLGLISGGWGLGGLINLLLVIALVLLILWLLRVL